MLRGMAVREEAAVVTLIVGEEELLVERAVKGVLTAAAGNDPDVHDVRGGDLSAGELSMLVAPSLFGGQNLVTVRGDRGTGRGHAAGYHIGGDALGGC
jgi:DNA polymerase III subunit delta